MSSSLSPFITDTIWQTALILAIGLLMSRFLTHWPSRAHQFLLVSISMCLVAPLLSYTVRQYEWGILPAQPNMLNSIENDSLVISFLGTVSKPVPETGVQRNKINPSATTTLPPSVKKDIPVAPAASVTPTTMDLSLNQIVILLWITMSGFVLLRLLFTSIKGFLLLFKAKIVVDNNLIQLLDRAAKHLELKRLPVLYQSDQVRCPVIYCWGVRPALLFPKTILKNNIKDDWIGIICHELAHWKRYDHIASFIAEIACCIIPWNPLIWWTRQQMNRFSEQACDRWALASGQPREDYADSLVNLLPQKHSVFALPALSLNSKKQKNFRIRLYSILYDCDVHLKTGKMWSCGVLLSLLSLVTCVSFAQISPSTQTDIISSNESTSEISQKEDIESSSLTIRKMPIDLDIDYVNSPAYSAHTSDGKYIAYVDWDTGNLMVKESATDKIRNLTNKGTWEDSNDYAEECLIAPNDKEVIFTWCNSKTKKYEIHSINLDGSNRKILYKDETYNYLNSTQMMPDKENIFVVIRRVMNGEVKNTFALFGIQKKSINELKSYSAESYWWTRAFLSPDYCKIVYEKRKTNGNRNIFLYDLSNKNEIPLVQESSVEDLLGWSEDGKWIFYTNMRFGYPCLWGLQINSNNKIDKPKLIYEFSARIRPQMTLAQNNILYFFSDVDRVEPFLYTMDFNTGKFLLPPKSLSCKITEPSTAGSSWSYNGKYTALISSSNGVDTKLHLVSDEDGSHKTIPTDFQWLSAASWSRDGNYLLCGAHYKIYYRDPDFDIYLYDVKESQFKLILKDKSNIPIGFAKDENYYYYLSQKDESGNEKVVKRHFESGEEEIIYTGNISHLPLLKTSFDRNWIVCHIEKDNSILLINLESSVSKTLYKCKPEQPKIKSLAWSPDNQSALFLMKEKQGKIEGTSMWKISINGGEPTKLWFLPMDINGSYTKPNSNQFLVNHRYTNRTIWAMENFIP